MMLMKGCESGSRVWCGVDVKEKEVTEREEKEEGRARRLTGG